MHIWLSLSEYEVACGVVILYVMDNCNVVGRRVEGRLGLGGMNGQA